MKAGRLGGEEDGPARSDGESDQPVVLGDGRADHVGKGLTGVRSLRRKHGPYKGDGEQCEPHYRE